MSRPDSSPVSPLATAAIRTGIGRRGAQRRTFACTIGLASLLFALGCSGGSKGPEPLAPDEVLLLEQALSLMEVRIERARDEARADSMRAALPSLYSEEQIDALVQRLSADPARAQLFTEALHESLKARRIRLFPPAVVGQ